MKAGWEEKALGDLASIVAGQSPKGDTYNDEGVGVPFYQGKKAFGRRDVGAATVWTTSPSKMAKQGDILMSVRAPVGPVNFAIADCCVGRGLAAIRVESRIDREFLFYLLQYKQPEITGNAGAVFSSINKKSIGEISIPLPPLAEQKQIVSVLDQAFAGIERAAQAARKNRDNARELFETTLNATFTQKGEGWVETTLGEVCEFSNGKAHEKAIDEQGAYIVVNSKFISQEGRVVKRTNELKHPLQVDDIVMVMSDVPKGKALAKCFLIPEDNKYSLNQRICSIKSQEFIPQFLLYHLNRHPFLLAFDNKGSQANLRKNDILSCPLFLPSKDEQSNVAARLDSCKMNTQRLETLYQQKLDALDELKQSLLQKAFAGELTPEFTADFSEHEAEAALAT